MTVSINNVARGIRLARDSGVPLSDILDNRNFTTLDPKDRTAVVKEYASTHEVEARPLSTSQRVKTLAARAAWGALSGAATGLPVAMVVRSGFLPLSVKPSALLTGVKTAFGDKSVRLGVGLMAGLGATQGTYNAVKKFQAQDSDRLRVHKTLEAIRSGDENTAESHAYGAMFGSIRHYDDPKAVTVANPLIHLVGDLVKPYEKAVNSINLGRLATEADELGLGEAGDRLKAGLHGLNKAKTAIDEVEAATGMVIPDEMKKNQFLNALKDVTDQDYETGAKAREIAAKAKMLKGMLEETGNSSILNQTQLGLVENAHALAETDNLTDIAAYLKAKRDSL